MEREELVIAKIILSSQSGSWLFLAEADRVPTVGGVLLYARAGPPIFCWLTQLNPCQARTPQPEDKIRKRLVAEYGGTHVQMACRVSDILPVTDILPVKEV